jgi:hypothetical protein
MHTGHQAHRVYRELADWHERQGQAQLRDRFLLLAADAALAGGDAAEAEHLRLRLLQHSPHHMLKPFSSFAEAMRSPDVQGYLGDLRQTYPLETAEQMLHSVHNGGEAPLAAPPPSPPPPPPAAVPAPTRQIPPPEPLKVFPGEDEARESEPAPPRQPPPPTKPTAKKPGPGARPAPRAIAVPAPPPRPVARSAPPAAQVPPPAPVPPQPPRAVASPPPPVVASPAPVVLPPPLPVRPAGPPPPAPLPLHLGVRRPPAGQRPDPLERGGGAWVSAGLFVLVLLAGLALAAWTFARPFLPREWLP